MKKYKICVYAICKNESQFVDKWMDSVSEADLVVVLDTGSTDDTVAKLKAKGAIVYEEIIKPWRFDVARNKSLSLVPEDVDICVCIDLDEIYDKGWRNQLENKWKETTTRARYDYTWSFNEDGTPGVTFHLDKIHSRKGYIWKNPVHEVLKYNGNNKEEYINCLELKCKHYPDSSKPRSQYLPLLEQSVIEDPMDDRNMHYLGREYMFYGMWDKCIDTLKKHLSLPTSLWCDERCASMRFIARAYRAKNEIYEAKRWLYRAIGEAPYLREPYLELAFLEYGVNNWEAVYHMIKEALKIEKRPVSYINEGFAWDATVYDLGSIACYFLGLYEEGLNYAELAINMNPTDERIANNYKLLKDKLV